MDNKIECPICEVKLKVGTLKPNSVLRCPSCARQFKYADIESQLAAAMATTSAGGDNESAELSKKSKLANSKKPKLKKPSLAIPDPSGAPSQPPSLPTAGVAGSNTLDDVQATGAKNSAPPIPVAAPVAFPAKASDAPIAVAQSITERESTSASLVAVRQRYKRRNRNRTYVTLAVASFFVVLIGGLSTWLVLRVNSVDPLANLQSESMDPAFDVSHSADAPDGGPTISPVVSRDRSRSDRSNQQASSKPKPPLPPKKIEFAKLPTQRFSYLSAKDADRVWKIAQKRVLSLTVHRPDGIHKATGIIVDSRGWVLTSHHAVAGATKIEITASAKIIDELYEADLLKDEVRGVIAADVARDLVLLSVNRRFVQSFGSVNFGAKQDMVQGQHAIQAAPPSAKNPYARVEVGVTNRFDADQLPPQVRSAAESQNTDDPSNVWIETKKNGTALPGTTLFTGGGKLTGLLAFTQSDLNYFLLLDEKAESFIRSAVDEPKPLVTIATIEQKQMIEEVAARNIFVTTDPIRQTLTELDAAGGICEKFGWIATTDDQFSSLQTFAARMSEVLIFTLENGNNDDEQATVELLKKQADKWRQSISNAIANRDRSQMDDTQKMIELSAKMMKRNSLSRDQQFIPFFGKVYVAGIVSPDPDAMFLAVGQGEAYLKTPYQATGKAMLPDSEWLFFTKRQSTRRTTTLRFSGTTFDAEAGQLMFAIGPLPSSY